MSNDSSDRSSDRNLRPRIGGPNAEEGKSTPVATILLVWSGTFGSLIGFVTVALATVASPTFSWTSNAISDLGAAQAANPWILNTGLFVAGFIGIPFGYVLWQTAANTVHRLGSVFAVSTMASLALIGVFFSGTALHYPISVSYFTLGTFMLVIYGTGSVLEGHPRRGLSSIWLGFGHVFAWSLWVLGIRFGPGAAIPELFGSLLFFVWILRTTRSLEY